MLTALPRCVGYLCTNIDTGCCYDYILFVCIQFGFSSAPGVVEVVPYTEFARAHEHHMVSGGDLIVCWILHVFYNYENFLCLQDVCAFTLFYWQANCCIESSFKTVLVFWCADGVAGLHGDDCPNYPPPLLDVVSQSLQIWRPQDQKSLMWIVTSHIIYYIGYNFLLLYVHNGIIIILWCLEDIRYNTCIFKFNNILVYYYKSLCFRGFGFLAVTVTFAKLDWKLPSLCVAA